MSRDLNVPPVVSVPAPVPSTHRLRLGYKILLVSACVASVVPVLALLPFFTDLPGTTPEAKRESIIVAAVSLAVFALPGAFVVAFTVRQFRQTIEVREDGLLVTRGKRESFVPWSGVEKVEIDRTDTEWTAMLVVTLATSRDMKAKVRVKNGPPIRLNSGIDGVEQIIDALWTHRRDTFVARK